MRTKTLLLAAAALAAGMITSQAAVTSANIVGYANITLPGGGAYSLLVTPLQGTNSAADTLLTSLQPGDTLYIWTGVGYYSSTYYGPGTGPNGEAWNDQYGNWTNAPTLSPGQGYFYSTQSGSVETNTFVGTVQLTNSIPFAGGGAYSLIGSTPPIGGALDSTNFNLPLQPGDAVYLWTGNGYYSSTFYGPGSGPNGEAWNDQFGNWTNAPTVSVGQGFFYSTQSGGAETWNQSLTVQ